VIAILDDSLLLGATLAEWQRRRGEEEAARRAAMFSGGGGEEEESDVHEKRRAKVIAKNEKKRDQERRWEAAKVVNSRGTDSKIDRSEHAEGAAIAAAAQAKKEAREEQRKAEDAERQAGLVSAVLVSFVVGYVVRWGVGSLAVESTGEQSKRMTDEFLAYPFERPMVISMNFMAYPESLRATFLISG